MEKAISLRAKHFDNMGNKVMKINILRGAAVVLIGMTATLGWAEGNPLTSEALAYVEYCSTDYDNATC